MKGFFFLIISGILAYGIGCLGRNRRIGFGWAFGLSLLNLFLGLIVVLLSKKKDSVDFINMNKNKNSEL